MTGYEVKKLFDATVAHFWAAELSQIYPTLKQLEGEGLAAMEMEVQDDKPNRKVYAITGDGRRELLDWLAMPAQVEQAREPLLAKVFFGAALSTDALVAVLCQRADELERVIAEHEAAPAHAGQFANALGLKEDGFFWTLTVEGYIARMRGELAWLKTAIERAGATRVARSRKRGPMLDARAALGIIDAHLGTGEHSGARASTAKPGRT